MVNINKRNDLGVGFNEYKENIIVYFNNIHKMVLSLVYFIYVLYIVRAQGVFVLSKKMQLESKIIHVTIS